MFNKGIISAIALIALFAVACGSSSQLQTGSALTGVLMEQGSYERISGANMTLVTAGGISTVTTENGVFVFRGVQTGTHTVRIEAAGRGTTEKTVEVRPGGSRVELFLE